MKIVINKGTNYYSKEVSIYGILYYYKLKSIQLYVYKYDNSNDNLTNITNQITSELKYNNNIYIIDKYLGETINIEDLYKTNVNRIYNLDFYNRLDSYLIQTIEDLKDEFNGNNYTKLDVLEIPDNVVYEILTESEYGPEYISEVHRIWK